MELDITASIVTYKNDLELLNGAIQSFLDTDLKCKLYILDNSPTNLISTMCKDRRIEYIFNNSNKGFGYAHNIILRERSKLGRYHIILNPDISYEKNVVEKLFDFLNENDEIGLVMPKILYPNGKIQYLAKLLPTPVEWIGRFFMPSKKWKNKRNYKFELQFTGYDKIMDVPYLSGCFMFIRSSVLSEIGVFDEGIFMYGEDTDLTRRIHLKYRTVFYPHVHVYHEFHKESHKNLRLFWIHVKAAIYYFNKWGWIFDNERKQINKKVLRELKY
jgi:GT2 family glycosyltransferase